MLHACVLIHRAHVSFHELALCESAFERPGHREQLSVMPQQEQRSGIPAIC